MPTIVKVLRKDTSKKSWIFLRYHYFFLNKVYPWMHLEKHFFPRLYKIALVASARLKVMKQEARLVMNSDGWLTNTDKLTHSVFTGRPAGCYTKQYGSWGFFLSRFYISLLTDCTLRDKKKPLRWKHAENSGFYKINKTFELSPPHTAVQLDRGDLKHEISNVRLVRFQSKVSFSIR